MEGSDGGGRVRNEGMGEREKMEGPDGDGEEGDNVLVGG